MKMISADEAAAATQSLLPLQAADGHHCIWLVARGLLLYAIVPAFAFFLLAPFVLATITLLLHPSRAASGNHHNTPRSALCAGRVWHTRFLPVRHAFQYPLFIFCLDLQEVERENGLLFSRQLWPLSLLVAFEESDHLKNGEGRQERSGNDATTINNTELALSQRLYRLVAERTNGKFQPTEETHSILLITHLRYYGYNFNPVSFYILQSRGGDSEGGEQISAVVGEVSNTPWNEMHCYVLHPDSVDRVKLVIVDDEQGDSGAQPSSSFEEQEERESPPSAQKLHYIFPKNFHVSPFMEMNYDYEWFFWNFSTRERNATIRIVNNLRQQQQPQSDAGPRWLQFTARMVVRRHSLHPYRIAWHVSTFPMYCAIVQLWIHYEAFRLFVKGVAFQPHPAGTETAASRWIGRLMRPFFALQAWWQQERSGSEKKKQQ